MRPCACSASTAEVREVFQLVKAVANFPNVVYVLAFDRKVVTRALGELTGGGQEGEDYLEKIVQVAFELPPPDKLSLEEMFLAGINPLIKETPDELFELARWRKLYREGLARLLSTPRDVVRLLNTLALTYPAVEGEVNAVDFVGLESLRVFCPKAHQALTDNPESFTGMRSLVSLMAAEEERGLKAFHDGWLGNIDERERQAAKNIVSILFPKLEGLWTNMSYSDEQQFQWRRKLRICVEEIFPVYLRLSVPQGGISRAEIVVSIAKAQDAKTFSAALVELSTQHTRAGTTRLREFLNRFHDYVQSSVPVEHVPNIIQAFLESGDELIKTEDYIPFDFSRNDIRIADIIVDLLRRLPAAERRNAIIAALKNGRAVRIGTMAVAWIGHEHGKYDSRESRSADRTLTLEELSQAETEAIALIERAVADRTLTDVPFLGSILWFWRTAAGDDKPASTWVQSMVETDQNLVVLLEKLATVGFSTVTEE